MQQIDYIAKRVNHPVRIIQCVQFFNEIEFAPLVLTSLYNKVDQIICIEGAVQNNSNATLEGHSTDGTLEFLREFKKNKDSQNKIILISINRFWKSLEEMKQTFLDLTQPEDILLICDCDEFYLPEDIDRIRKFFDREPMASELIPTFLHFYRDFNHIAVPGPEWNCQHQRIIKHPGHGSKYNSHPVLTDPEGQCTYFSPHYQSRRFVPKNPIYIWHYGYARSNMDKRMKQKQEYYSQELAKHNNANLKFDQKIKAWFEDTEPILYYDGDHPEIIKTHPVYLNPIIGWRTYPAAIEKGLIKNWLEDSFYKKIYNSEEVGNISLCMSKQTQPYMNFYNNGTEI